MKLPIVTFAGLFALFLAGCSSGSSGYSGSSASSGGSALPPPDPMVAPPVSESGEATGVVAETSVAVESSPSEPVVGTGAVISIPEAGGWTNLSIPLSQYQTDIDACFCGPRRPWQHGSNEHPNDLLRQSFPKRTDSSVYSQAHLNKVARQLNERPRKTLEFETPAERFNACVASTG